MVNSGIKTVEKQAQNPIWGGGQILTILLY